jgi:hypothetical protein
MRGILIIANEAENTCQTCQAAHFLLFSSDHLQMDEIKGSGSTIPQQGGLVKAE